MSVSKRRKKRQSFLLVANYLTLFCTLAVATAASLVNLNPRLLHDRVSQETYAQIQQELSAELDVKYSKLLEQAKMTINETEEILIEQIDYDEVEPFNQLSTTSSVDDLKADFKQA